MHMSKHSLKEKKNHKLVNHEVQQSWLPAAAAAAAAAVVAAVAGMGSWSRPVGWSLTGGVHF